MESLARSGKENQHILVFPLAYLKDEEIPGKKAIILSQTSSHLESFQTPRASRLQTVFETNFRSEIDHLLGPHYLLYLG